MKKLLALLGIGMLAAMWSGCGITDPVSAPRITIDAIGSIAIAKNDVEKWVIGKIEADTAISSISATVETAAGVEVPSTQIAVTTAPGNGENTQNLTATRGIKLTIKSAAITGNYTLKITVVAGVTGSGEFDFKLTGNAGTAITSDDVIIGSFDNATYGSSIDLDKGTVLKANKAVENNSGVDICGTYSTKANSVGFRIFNPVYAKDSSDITAFADWINPAATSFHKVTVDFASITSVEQIEPLYVAASKVDFAIVQPGDVYVVKTSENKFALIKIVSFESTVTGSAVIKYGK